MQLAKRITQLKDGLSSDTLLHSSQAHRVRTRAGELVWSIFRYVLIIGISFIIVYPLLLKLSVAFKSRDDIFDPTIFIVPKHFTFSNVEIAVKVLKFFPTLGQTLLFVVAMMILSTASCALAGYGFARFSFPGRNLLFGLVVLTILVPAETLMVPTYLHFRSFDFLNLVTLFTGKDGINLMNSYWPSTILSVTANGLKAGLYIYIFRQFFRGMPAEIEEAALIDGAGGIATFFRIMLPNAVPPLITVMLFAFVWQYNDTFYNSMFMSDMHLMPSQIASLPGNAGVYISTVIYGGADPNAKPDPNYVAMIVDTGLLVAISPLIVMYLFVQRYFVESVERTGVVG
ncbi:multiple sugar transport system permease protein [Paenibacillus cellulosilyticus]|uniref:Multiple sugar transport system permease protein n=1 Tax=Paenibacillus cellulosilyticus TaxID=375489 RepID=A0A2V2Z7W0_9BACL|nr:carbohydrate ABC transporter permease [Paenibacillus cellulosilyticus]PWW07446.1 multiple sugar transport system permease protein [Paenibacillus cellulosilyticus]QKS44395.1 carbohydrate ABC transporter permease [Paenibacillus cellulosilyticus]